MKIIIEEREAAERPPEARARDQEVEKQPHIGVVGVECVQVSGPGAEIVPRVFRHDVSQPSNAGIQDPKLNKYFQGLRF